MLLPTRRGARWRSAFVATAVVAMTVPASAGALTITSLKAGPVAPYSNPAALPFIPASSGPVAAPTPGASTLTADTNCAYGVVQPAIFVPDSITTYPGSGAPPAASASNARPVYNTDAPDTPLVQTTGTAGAFSDFCVAFRSTAAGTPTAGERVKDNLLELPVGVTAGIDATVKCSEEAFGRHKPNFDPITCPPQSIVGTAMVRLKVPAPVSPLTPDGTAVRDSPGRLYALETPAGQAARFGVGLVGGSRAVDLDGPGPGGNYAVADRATKFAIDVSQNGSATIGLLNQTDELAKVVPNAGGNPDGKGNNVVPIQLQGGAFRFWGSADAHPHGTSGTNPAAPWAANTKMATNFLRMPTTCSKDLTTKLTVNPYTAASASDVSWLAGDPAYYATATSSSAEFSTRLTGCESLPFDPSASIELTGDTKPGAHPGLKFSAVVPDGQEDLGGTTVVLPTGVATDLANVQNGCAPAVFLAGGCAADQIIGKVTAEISGVDSGQVGGDVYKVRVEGQTLPALGLALKGRFPLRVAGESRIDPSGRIINTFKDLPAFPQRALNLELFGGEKGLLQIPPNAVDICAVSSYDVTLVGQNGKSKTVSRPTTCGEKFRASIKGADTRRPYIHFSGAGATGKKVQSIRLTLPKGLTIAKNRIRSGSKIDKLELTVTGRTTRVRISKKSMRFSIPKPGSNGLRILTRKGTLNTSAKFRKRDNDMSVVARVVYTDGTKSNTTLPLERK